MALILIIEDETILRENCKELLIGCGHQCITASEGHEGIKMAQIWLPDIIICDITLPGINGFEIKHILNDQEITNEIPFIYLTGSSDRCDLRQAMEVGAADFITKPFKIKEISDTIDRIGRNKRAVERSINKQVAHALSDFVHVARHECNTPLHGIINLAHLLKRKSLDSSSELIIESIQASGKRLHKTLNNLIDLMRLTHYSDGYMLEIQSVNLQEIIWEQMVRFRKKYSMEIYLVCNNPDNLCVQCVPEDLILLVTELIDNGCKFSDGRAPLKIEIVDIVGSSGKSLGLNFYNEMSPELPVLSVKEIGLFKQSNRASSEQQGSGLGLELVKIICQRYGFTFKIAQEPENKLKISIIF